MKTAAVNPGITPETIQSDAEDVKALELSAIRKTDMTMRCTGTGVSDEVFIGAELGNKKH